MPKKGEKLHYQVQFQYPGQPQHSRRFSSLSQAESEGGAIGRRGAEVILRDTSQASGPVVLAKFGPDVFHLFDWYNTKNPKLGLYCRCGRIVSTDDDGSSHMTAAGLCWECWGTGMVAQRATREGGEPMAGNLIHCPVCSGSGQDAEVSYHDVDMGVFYSRVEMLRLETV